MLYNQPFCKWFIHAVINLDYVFYVVNDIQLNVVFQSDTLNK